MTLEELKLEADKLCYKLVKKQKSIKLLPCICGSKRRSMWITTAGGTKGVQRILVCDKCGMKAPPGNTIQEAKENRNKIIKENWNRIIEESADVTTRLYK